jgi:hypothetical protein
LHAKNVYEIDYGKFHEHFNDFIFLLKPFRFAALKIIFAKNQRVKAKMFPNASVDVP